MKESKHKRNNNRKTEVFNTLRISFPDQFKETLTKLCSTYNDIFDLETKTVTTNNFYKQKLRVKDPVYIKNYSIPHTHKEEIYKQVMKLILLVPKKSYAEINDGDL